MSIVRCPPLQDFDFHAFDIDLDRVAHRQIETVERRERYLFTLICVAQRHAAEVGTGQWIYRGNQNLADLRTHRHLLGIHIDALIERKVGTERLENDSLRLKGMDLPRCANQPREINRMSADICTDLNHDRARADELLKQILFTDGKLTILSKGSSNVDVKLVVDHWTGSTHPQFVVSVGVQFNRRLTFVAHRSPLVCRAYLTASRVTSSRVAFSAKVGLNPSSCNFH